MSKTALIYGDTHIPFHDDQCLATVKALIKDVKPGILLHMGDLIDAWQISKFPKDPTRKESLQRDINLAANHLNEMIACAPRRCRGYYLEGNHEDRLTRAIWGMSDSAKEIAGLDNFQQYINWPSILSKAGMSRRWRFVEAPDQSRTEIIPNLITKHGTRVTRWSAHTAKAEWMSYGKSGLSGHTHRLGQFFHRDHNGTHMWAETGCTCDLNPKYTLDPDWHHGILVVTYTDDWFHTELVYIENGEARWRDCEY